MKKVLLVCFACSMLAMVSCKKEYTCECTYNGTTTTHKLPEAKKSDAKFYCDLMMEGETTVICELK